MPRITRLRVLMLLPCLYLMLIGLWLALPFPPSTSLERNGYHQHVLRSGGTLTTVHWQTYLTQPDEHIDKKRSAFAIQWRLTTIDTDQGKCILLLVDDKEIINLTNLAKYEKAPYIVPESKRSKGPSGDQDGVNLPYFPFTDATLLFWEIHHEMVDLKFRVTMPQDGVVQVWPGGVVMSATPESSNLAYIILSDIPIEDEDRGDISKIKVQGMTGDVPSKTYHVRRRLVKIIAPVVFPVNMIVRGFAGTSTGLSLDRSLYFAMVIMFLYATVVTVCWVLSGRPNFHMWSKTFILTRRLVPKGDSHYDTVTKRHIWDLSGPVTEKQKELERRRRAPTPLTNLSGFFSSTSPLDDLLVTFERTKWMVQPVRQVSVTRRHDAGDVESSSVSYGGPKIKISRG